MRNASHFFWKRHASPWSVWSFVGMFPMLVFALYRRDARLLAATLSLIPLNLFVVPEPEDAESWATRVVLGEQVWIERGLPSGRDFALTTVLAPVILFTIYSALRRRGFRTALGTIASLTAMMVFFQRMVNVYDEAQDASD